MGGGWGGGVRGYVYGRIIKKIKVFPVIKAETKQHTITNKHYLSFACRYPSKKNMSAVGYEKQMK